MPVEIILNKKVSFLKSFSEDEVAVFSSLSEDDNPIHLDQEYASTTIFKQRVVHGILLTSMFSKIFGTIYPGIGSIYLEQNTKFLKPVFLDETIKASVTLEKYNKENNRGEFLTECFNERNQRVLTGKAVIIFPQ